MNIIWTFSDISQQFKDNFETAGEIVMDELSIDPGEYKIEGGMLVGSPFPFKLKWFLGAKRFCIYDVKVMQLIEGGLEVRLRLLNLIYGPLIIPVVGLLYKNLEGFIWGLGWYFGILVFFGITLFIQLLMAKQNIKKALQSTN